MLVKCDDRDRSHSHRVGGNRRIGSVKVGLEAGDAASEAKRDTIAFGQAVTGLLV